jgi:hypothetical protein
MKYRCAATNTASGGVMINVVAAIATVITGRLDAEPSE